MKVCSLLTRTVPTCLLIAAINLHPPLSEEGPLCMTVCLALFFLFLPNNCIVPVNIYLDKSSLEMPLTLIMLYVFLVGLVKYPPLPLPKDSFSLAVSICFHLLLAINMLTYFLCTILFTIYSVYILFVMFRRPHELLVVNTGLRASEMKRLERISLVEVDSESNQEQLCPICQTDFLPEHHILQMPICNHFYHAHCIKEWLSRSIICPMCRSDIRSNLAKQRQQKLDAA